LDGCSRRLKLRLGVAAQKFASRVPLNQANFEIGKLAHSSTAAAPGQSLTRRNQETA
jgi:hypothetical protein